MDSREDKYLYYLENEDETPTPIRRSLKRDDEIHFSPSFSYVSTSLMDYVGVDNWEVKNDNENDS